MDEQLQDQINEYQESLQSLREEGLDLRRKLESLNWATLPKVFNYNGIVMVSPALVSHEDWNLTFFDDQHDWWNIEGILRLSYFHDDNCGWFEHIVEIAVTR